MILNEQRHSHECLHWSRYWGMWVEVTFISCNSEATAAIECEKVKIGEVEMENAYFQKVSRK